MISANTNQFAHYFLSSGPCGMRSKKKKKKKKITLRLISNNFVRQVKQIIVVETKRRNTEQQQQQHTNNTQSKTGQVLSIECDISHQLSDPNNNYLTASMYFYLYTTQSTFFRERKRLNIISDCVLFFVFVFFFFSFCCYISLFYAFRV